MAEAARAGSPAYCLRRARDSPLYRLAETHHESLKQVYDERFAGRYSFWRAEIERTVFAFLDCGIEERGFARVRCNNCRREFRVALSCKTCGAADPDCPNTGDFACGEKSGLRATARGLLQRGRMAIQSTLTLSNDVPEDWLVSSIRM